MKTKLKTKKKKKKKIAVNPAVLKDKNSPVPVIVSEEAAEKVRGHAGPPLLITPEVEELILDGISNGQTMVWICSQLRITRQTEWNYRKIHPAYSRKLSAALERRVEMVVDSLYSKAVEGDVSAQKFYLTNRSGKQWRNIQETQVGGIEEGHPIRVGVKEIIVELPKSAMDDDIAEIPVEEKQQGG